MVFVDSAISTHTVLTNLVDKWYKYVEILVDKRNKHLQNPIFKETIVDKWNF